MYYIQHIESIGHQDTFLKENVWERIHKLTPGQPLVAPDYKHYIPAASLRRLSTILRIGIVAAKSCQEKVGQEFDAISVGTSLGCLTDTEKFLLTINTVSGDVLSPTAFIQSTHNTISGQISLDLKNHAYNMTHTQNALSFEVALKDAMLCVDEGKRSVLVGSADEAIPFLERLRGELIHTDLPFTTGATFLVLSPEKKTSVCHIVTCEVFYELDKVKEAVGAFLASHQLETVDLILEGRNELSDLGKAHHCFAEYTGYYQTASSFAVHLAQDWLKDHADAKVVLVANNLDKGKLGLTLIRRNET